MKKSKNYRLSTKNPINILSYFNLEIEEDELKRLDSDFTEMKLNSLQNDDYINKLKEKEKEYEKENVKDDKERESEVASEISNFIDSKASNFIKVGSYFGIFTPPFNISYRENLLKKFRFYSLIVSWTSFISIILSVIDYEVVFIPTMQNKLPQVFHAFSVNDNINIYFRELNSITIRIFLSFSCFVILISNLLAIYYSNQFKEEIYSVPKNSNWILNNLFSIILESLMIIIHPIPYGSFFLDINNLSLKRKYHFDSFLYGIHILKFYFYTKVILETSTYNNLFSNTTYIKFNCKPTMLFIMKCFIKSNGFLFMTYSMIHTILILSYFLRMYDNTFFDYTGNNETGYIYSEENKYYYFNNFSNSMFMVIESLTTVGFGEFSVETHIGRLIIIISVFIGQFVTSLIIILVMNSAEFDKNQQRSFILLKRFMYRQKLKSISARIISISAKAFLLKRKLLVDFQIKLKKEFNNNSKYFLSLFSLYSSSSFLLLIKAYNENEAFLVKENKKIFDNQKLFQLRKKREKYLEEFDKISLYIEKETFNTFEDKIPNLNKFIETTIFNSNSSEKSFMLYKERIIKALLYQRKLMDRLDLTLNFIKNEY